MNRLLLWVLVALFGLSAGLIVMGIAMDRPSAPSNPIVTGVPISPSYSPYAPDDTGKPTPGSGSFCGGIAAIPCPSGYSCRLDGNYPDAGGTCVRDGIPPEREDTASSCAAAGGKWNATYRECEGVDEDACAIIGGKFDDCASACRHNPDKDAPCIMMCVAVCSF
jgi:hypothetical protein